MSLSISAWIARYKAVRHVARTYRNLEDTMIRILSMAALFLLAVNGWAQQRQAVSTPEAPKAIGPYSQAIKAEGFVFTAGQIPLDPSTGQIVGSDIATQTDRVLQNLQAVLRASGTNIENVVKTTVYLKNIADFSAVNEIYGHYFKSNPPARSAVQVANLPKDSLVEIEAIAVVPASH
jgi:2-iminobutanoate/2-iminopropanoate deaminase